MSGSIRDAINHLAPPWLSTGAAEKYLYSFGLGLDMLIEKLFQGMKMHIPTKADATALPFIGADRLIGQGPSESNANYATRLKYAFDDWRVAGNARSIVQQLRGYLSPFSPTIRVVDRIRYDGFLNKVGGDWYTYTPDMDPQKVPPSVTQKVDVNLDDLGGMYSSLAPRDPVGTQWWNFWVIIYSTGANQWATSGPTYADGHKWGDGSTWGSSKPQSYFDGMRALVQQWKARHAWCRGIFVVYAAENQLFDPTGVIGTDGTWGFWHKNSNGNAIAARDPRVAFIDGSDNYNVSTPFASTSAPTDQLITR